MRTRRKKKTVSRSDDIISPSSSYTFQPCREELLRLAYSYFGRIRKGLR